MKKKLIALIAMVLIVASLSIIAPAAITYECNVETNSATILVANLESEDFVYEKYPDRIRYASTMVTLLDYLVVLDEIDDLETTISITPELLADIPENEGTLDKYEGMDLTIQDLLTIMMLTNGNDSAYVLANYIGKGRMADFVVLMEKKLKELGCTKSTFVTARPIASIDQVTTCREVYIIFKELLKYDSFVTAASLTTYNVDKTKTEDDEPDVVTDNSLKRRGSPYYFAYVKQSKFGYDETSRQNVASVGEYKDNSYIVVAMGGPDDNEKNAMTDTKQLLIWAFTKLENAKIISEGTVVSSVKVKTPFGDDSVNLKVDKTVVRTLPSGYLNSDVTVSYDVPDEVKMPAFAGQKIGKGTVMYKDEKINGFDLVVANSKGVSIIEDIRSAVKGMYNEVLTENVEPGDSTAETAE